MADVERKPWWRFWLNLGFSLAIAAAFVAWVHSQGIALVPTDSVVEVLTRSWWGPVGFVLFLLVVHFLRAMRWLYLLRPLTKEPLSLSHLMSIAFVGFMAIMIMPFRTGELVRPFLISTRGKVKMSTAFGTIAIERILDGLILSGILTACLLLIPESVDAPHWTEYVGLATLSLFVTATLVLIAMLWKGERAVSRLESLGSKVWPRLAEKIAGVLREFLSGLAALPDRRHLVPFIVMSLAYWGINGLGMWFLARACGLPLSLVGGYTIMTILGVGILIPTGPGQLGNFQASIALALELQGLSNEQIQGPGSALIFLMYLCILSVTAGAGALAILSGRVSLSSLFTRKNGKHEQLPSS